MASPTPKTYRVVFQAGYGTSGGGYGTSPTEHQYRKEIEVISNEPPHMLRDGLALSAMKHALHLPELVSQYECDHEYGQRIIVSVHLRKGQRKPAGFDGVFTVPAVFDRAELVAEAARQGLIPA